ncbi:MAG: hypothetical protein U9P14_11700, partial [Gemmatimonadota bacterium]|nr:hypothetical protein [Gemmatimonadota bacterium]
MNLKTKHRTAICSALVVLFSLFSGSLCGLGAQESPEGFIPKGKILFRDAGAVDKQELIAALPDSIRYAGVIEVIDKVQGELHSRLGYHSARIVRRKWVKAPGDKSLNQLQVWIERGRPVRLGDVVFEGLRPWEMGELGRISRRVLGAVASDEQVERLLSMAARYFADRGYPYCVVRVTRAAIGERGRLELALGVDKGRPVSLGAIRFSGLTHTRPGVAKRITRSAKYLAAMDNSLSTCSSEATAPRTLRLILP